MKFKAEKIIGITIGCLLLSFFVYSLYKILNDKQILSYPIATTLSIDEFNQYIKDHGENGIVCEITLGSREKGNRIKHCYDKKQNMLIYLKSNDLKNSENQGEK